MTRTSFLVGISAIALATGTANAQYNVSNNGATGTTTVTTNSAQGPDANGNRAILFCAQGTGNACVITQGASGDTFDSTASVGVYGSNNNSTVDQRGNNHSASSSIGLNGTSDYNSNFTRQRGFNNSSTINQNGVGTATVTANSATVVQGAGTNNANNNTANIVQVRTATAATQAGNTSRISQGTSSNTNGDSRNNATSTQNGTNLSSVIVQADTTSAAQAGDFSTNTGATGIAASNNSATVSQTGRSGTATTGSSSTVLQSQRGNTARVDLFDGGVAVDAGTLIGGRNDSTVTQSNAFVAAGNTGFFTATNGTLTASTGTASQTTANSPLSNNSATVALTGQQNVSTISQNGVQNTAQQFITNGGTGNTSAANNTNTNPITTTTVPGTRPQGNSSTITQTGRGNAAITSIGGRPADAGQGNLSQITQSQVDAAVTAASGSNLSSTLVANNGHRASVYQRGTLDSATVDQSNNTLGGAAGGTTQSGSFADVSQFSFNSSLSVTQVGTNYALAVQGSAGSASNNLVINQIDAGDVVTGGAAGTGGVFGGTGAGGATSTQASNTVLVSQTGIQNTATVGQNAVNASASIEQRNVGGTVRGSQLNVQQGTQSAAAVGPFATANQITLGFSTNQLAANRTSVGGFGNLSASANQYAGQTGTGTITQNNAAAGTQNVGIFIAQGGNNQSATATQQTTPVTGNAATAATPSGTALNTANDSRNSILIGQGGSFNSATVSQTGIGQVATVEQRGVGTSANRNLITISQTTASASATVSNGNKATATQTTNAGASASGNTAVATDPQGLMSRSGVNSAEIAIFQTGFGNSATVEQRGKGQYASITQNNANNTNTTQFNTGTILQDTGATNAVAILNQTGANNTYTIYQNQPGQFARVTQTGDNNNTVVASGAVTTGGNGTVGGAGTPLPAGTGIGTVN